MSDKIPLTYKVKRGDSLSSIAQKMLGNANRWPELATWNRSTIPNPDFIYPGQVIKLVRLFLLGNFKYHNYEVKLEARDDETEFVVTYHYRSNEEVREQLNGSVDVKLYRDLREARDEFEKICHECIGRTSFTDVSIFSQQTNGY